MNYAKIAHEIMQAYIDCWEDMKSPDDWVRCRAARNLNFRASEPITRKQAIAFLKMAIPHGCNDFRAEVLEALPEDTKVTVARENSVCIYVTPKPSDDVIRQLDADESSDCQEKGWRFWWD